MKNRVNLENMLQFYPIKAVRQYPSGLTEVVRVKGRNLHPSPTNGIRSQITEFTWKARKAMLHKLMKLDVNWTTMITLTYPNDFPTDGKKVKADLNRFLTWYRRKFAVLDWPPHYFWWIEFQLRGAPHFHILTDFKVFERFSDVAMVAERWAKQITDQMPAQTRTQAMSKWYTFLMMAKVHSHPTAISEIREHDGAIRYCTKYAHKMQQKVVPDDYTDIGRFWGYSNHSPEYAFDEIETDEDALREYLKLIDHPCQDWQVIPREIYDNTRTA